MGHNTSIVCKIIILQQLLVLGPSQNWKEIVFDKFNFSGEVSKYNAITSNLGDSGLGVVNTEITTNYINKSRPNVSFQSW